jgi:L-alanine-DL-glutamate epimerase-like enolase superfamily enzyme
VATAVPNVVFQESVRAHIRSFYSQLIDTNVQIENGFALPPTAPGLGTRLLPSLFSPSAPGYRISHQPG